MADVGAVQEDLYAIYVQPAIGELIGTGLFVLFANLASTPSPDRPINYSLISGLALFIIRGFFADITNGHFNPAVSISQALVRRLDIASAIAFVVVQLAGGLLGAVVFRALMTDMLYMDYMYDIIFISDEVKTITRSQGFFLTIILYSAVCFSYLYAHGAEANLRISSCWATVSYFSISLIGQSGNFAQTLANAVVYYVSSGDPTAVGYLYLHISAALIAIVLTSATWWLLSPNRTSRESKSSEPVQNLRKATTA
ncbi:hypothetical protein V3C99_011812 [Haemonchus contortus]|uniref:Aquaporin-like protein n=1 Tax=Haemonchus contortus TaxID=6289 RepID=A0A7I4Y4F1_HAECO|nr:Major intrinsic protein domain containing protein [Haemonchus contortus]